MASRKPGNLFVFISERGAPFTTDRADDGSRFIELRGRLFSAGFSERSPYARVDQGSRKMRMLRQPPRTGWVRLPCWTPEPRPIGTDG